MSKVRVESFTISIDGFGAGPDQDLTHPLGVGLRRRAVSPVLLGSGERLFEGVNLPALGYVCTQHQSTARATHLVFARQ